MREIQSGWQLTQRMDACMAELVDIFWSALGTEGEWNPNGNAVAREIKKITGDNDSHKTLLMEVLLIDRITAVLEEVIPVARDQARAGMASLIKMELAKPVQITVPASRYEELRRKMLRSLFNACCYLDANGKRHSAQLGKTWFASADDKALIPGTAHLRKLFSERRKRQV